MNKNRWRQRRLRQLPFFFFCLRLPPSSSLPFYSSSLSLPLWFFFFTHPRSPSLFFAEDGSSFSSLIMPNSTPICHVYSAATKEKEEEEGEPRLCPLYPLCTLYHLCPPHPTRPITTIPITLHRSEPNPHAQALLTNWGKLGLRSAEEFSRHGAHSLRTHALFFVRTFIFSHGSIQEVAHLTVGGISGLMLTEIKLFEM